MDQTCSGGKRVTAKVFKSMELQMPFSVLELMQLLHWECCKSGRAIWGHIYPYPHPLIAVCLWTNTHTLPFCFPWPVTHRMFIFSHNHWWTHMTPPLLPHFHWGVNTHPCLVTAINWQQAHPKSPRAQPCQHSVKTVDILKKTAQQPLTSMDFSPPGLSETETPQRLNGVHKTRHSSLAQLEVAVLRTGSHSLWWLSCHVLQPSVPFHEAARPQFTPRPLV